MKTNTVFVPANEGLPPQPAQPTKQRQPTTRARSFSFATQSRESARASRSPLVLGAYDPQYYLRNVVALVPLHYLVNKGANRNEILHEIKENEKLPFRERSFAAIINPDNPDQIFILDRTIPTQFKIEFGIGEGETLRADIRFFDSLYERKTCWFGIVAERLVNAYHLFWPSFTSRYWELTSREDYIEFYARKQAVLNEVINEFSATKNQLYVVYNEIAKVFFKELSLDRFYKITKLIADYPESAHIIICHGSLDKHKVNIRFNDEAKEIALEERRKRTNTIADVLRVVNAFILCKGKKEIDISTLKRFFAIPEVKNFLFLERNKGDVDAINHLIPYLDRKRCSRFGLQWQVDTFDVPLACIDILDPKIKKALSKKDVGEIVIKCCIVVDNHSGAIIGFSSDRSENHRMVIAALRMAVYNTGILPIELLADNHKLYGDEEFLHIRAMLQLFGCRFRQEKLRHPQDKSVVEQTVRNIHAIFRRYSGYTGHGIRSRRRDSRPTAGYRKEAFKPQHVRDVAGIDLLIPEIIKQYNDHSFNEKPTPTQLRESSQEPVELKIEKWKVAKLFWVSKWAPVIGGKIKFTYGDKYKFRMYDYELSENTTDTEVRCRFDQFDPSTILVFHSKTDVYLGEVKGSKSVPTLAEEYDESDTEVANEHYRGAAMLTAAYEKKLAGHEAKTNKILDENPAFLEKIFSDEDSVYSSELSPGLEDYLSQNKIFENIPKETSPIAVTLIEKRRGVIRKANDSLAPVSVLEEMDL